MVEQNTPILQATKRTFSFYFQFKFFESKMKAVIIVALTLSALILLAESSPLQSESSESSEERIAKRQDSSSDGKKYNYRIYSRISRPAYKLNWKNILEKMTKI